MKLTNLHEDYCDACGGWDKEQWGRGHKLGCPVGEPDTPIARSEEPDVEEDHALVVAEFDADDVEEVYTHIKAYGGTIVERRDTPTDVVATVIFDGLKEAGEFARLGCVRIKVLPRLMRDLPAQDAQHVHELMHNYVTGQVDAQLVKDFYLS